MSQSSTKIKSLRYLPALSVLAFAVAAASQANKQLVENTRMIKRAQASGKFFQTHLDVPRRATILDTNGEFLAKQRDGSTLEVSFKNVPHSPAMFRELGEATGIAPSEFLSLADSGTSYRTWSMNLTPQQMERVNAIKTSYRANGIALRNGGDREYPLGEAASGIIGIVKGDGGICGLELSQNGSLSGKSGKRVGLVDRRGKFLPMRMDAKSEKRVDGDTLTLTLNSQLQEEATRLVRRSVEAHEAKSGIAIVLVPSTGDVLTMASWPSFDPVNPGTAQSGDENSLGYNPCTMSILEPGSTFKVLTLAKAIDVGGASINDFVHCNGSLRVWSKSSIRCDSHNGHRAHGDINSTMAIAKSCNVSAALWAKQIGRDSFIKFMEDLGILSKSKLGLPLETAGSIYRDEYATGLQLANFGFGQSINTTPIALAGAFGTLANGGVRMEPRLIKKVGGREIAPVSTGRVLKEESCEIVLDAMRNVIDNDRGTGTSARISGYEMGGKTGTAQKTNRKTGTMKDGGYVSNFVGFIPARKPKVVILIMIDDPKGSYYGGAVAAPVFKDLAKACIKELDLPRSSERDLLPIRSAESQPKSSSKREPTEFAQPKFDVKVEPARGR